MIRPGPMCEPFYIQFGDDLFLQNYVKTQFAGVDVHIAIVKLRPMIINTIVAKNPRARARVKMPDGRIIDLIQ